MRDLKSVLFENALQRYIDYQEALEFCEGIANEKFQGIAKRYFEKYALMLTLFEEAGIEEEFLRYKHDKIESEGR